MQSGEHPSHDETRLAELDAHIAELEARLESAQRERLALTPPPPLVSAATASSTPESSAVWQAPTVPAAARVAGSPSGAQVTLGFGAVALVAAVVSFAGFVWPRLTTEMRMLALGALIAALATGAVWCRNRLIALAEALAASSGVSLSVLSVWWYATLSDDPSVLGASGVLMMTGAVITCGAQYARLRSWEWGAAIVVTASCVGVSVETKMIEIAAVGFALVLAVLAWRARWWRFAWGSGVLLVVATAAASDRLSQTELPAFLPFAVLGGALAAGSHLAHSGRLRWATALENPTASRDEVRLVQSIKQVVGGLGGVVGVVTLVAVGEALTSRTLVGHLDAVLLLVSVTALVRTRRETRDLVPALLVLVLMTATANLAAVWVLLSSAVAFSIRPRQRTAVVVTVTLFLTAMSEVASSGGAHLLVGDTPAWFALACAAVFAAAACLTERDSRLALIAAGAGSLAVLSLRYGGFVELRSVPVALVLAVSWFVARCVDGQKLLTWWLAPSTAVLVIPTAVLVGASSDAPLLRFWLALGVSCVFAISGARWRLAGLLAPGLLGVAVVVWPQLTSFVSDLPVWIPLVLAAVALLTAGARFEQLERQGRRTAAWLSDLR